MSRRTTWTGAYYAYKMKNGEIRRNPLHNQIDYILLDRKYARFITNARSYNNVATSSDHNMVIMNLKMEVSLNSMITAHLSQLIIVDNSNVVQHNECSICFKLMTEATMMKTCKHVFCMHRKTRRAQYWKDRILGDWGPRGELSLLLKIVWPQWLIACSDFACISWIQFSRRSESTIWDKVGVILFWMSAL